MAKDRSIRLRARWVDPGLRHESAQAVTYPLEDVWHPRLQIANRQRVTTSAREEVEVMPDGTVLYVQRYWGQFSNALDLTDFPFDRHSFAVRVVAADRPGEVELVASDDPRMQPRLGERLSIADWSIESWEAAAGTYEAASTLSSYVF